MHGRISRRELVGAGGVALALGALGCAKHGSEEAGEDVSPGEDLMREHGVLSRISIIYEAAARRLEAGDLAALEPVRSAAGIARVFVEDYHEQIEELYVFPRFERAGKLVELVTTLRRQHDAGRTLTDRIVELSRARLADPADRTALAAALRGYATMFAPHLAREDTVLFPAFHALVGKEYGELGDRFEHEERRRFGKDGFEHFVAQLPPIEQAAGVADLMAFTVTADESEPEPRPRRPDPGA